MIKVLLADSQVLTREGIIALLLPVKGIVITGSATSPANLKELAKQHEVQVVLIDYQFYNEVVTDAPADFSPARILMLHNGQQRTEILELINSGIKNHLSKACDADELTEAIYTTARGEGFLCVKTTRLLYGAEQPVKPDAVAGLSSREAEIAHMIADGLANKEIAEKLFLSVHTVKTHRKNIIKKLGFTFKNAAELILVLGTLNEFI